MPVEIEPLPLAFGAWEITPISPVGDVSFDLQAEPGEQFAIWELDLPADRSVAQSELHHRAEFLQLSQDVLEDVPARVENFIDKVRRQEAGEISYDLAPSLPLSELEQDTLRLLTYLELGPDETSFAAGEQPQTELDQASLQFQTAFERMLQLVSHFAWVETQIEAHPIGRTVVSWSGDLQTMWGEGVYSDDYGLHQQALRQALVTRNILVHACVVTTQSAAKLAVLLTNPAGAILALPVAWKLVNQILSDIEKYQNITKQER